MRRGTETSARTMCRHAPASKRDIHLACVAFTNLVCVQELLDKAPQLPKDTRWHFVGHLQSNKAKMLIGEAELLMLIYGVH